ncbi:hypothetical protein Fmac_015008 [Flemingia macrophylla]|uniref:Uncharacterized protein n=1 Tax=Flemingia macrophylla TaxID=520843 RepID=A0ABD1MDB1_9FABA
MSSEVVLQEAPQREARTILGLLTEQMDGVESGGNRRRRMLKERFGFMGCCRAAWANTFRSHHREQPQRQMDPDPDPGAGMNLAAALAAERRLRGLAEEEGEAPWRVSLMRLLWRRTTWTHFFRFLLFFVGVAAALPLRCGKMGDLDSQRNCGVMPLRRWPQPQYCVRNVCCGPQFETLDLSVEKSLFIHSNPF